MSKFHTYSFRNTMLIFLQKPDASLVAGAGKWQSEFERTRKQGERGLKILAPNFYKVKKRVPKKDPDTGEPIKDKDGKPLMDEQEITVPDYRVVSVYDISQTEGKELPEAHVNKLKDLSAPNSPNKTHFMVEISPHFDALASTKDNDRLFAMLPYKSLCFTSIKDRHGVYAMINKDERRDVSIRKPRPSIRKQLADSKQATSPKKAAARTKKNELEV